MKKFIPIILLASLPFALLAQSPQEPNDNDGEIRYISDDLFTFIHAGPSRDFRILGSVSAGTAVRLLQTDRDAGYVEIIDDRQRTGWVEMKFVSRNPSIRILMDEKQQALEQQQAAIYALTAEIDAININLAQAKQQKISLNRQITSQLEEIANLNLRLSEKDKANKIEWFTRGTILALISVLIGYILGFFGRKTKGSDRLM